MGKQYIGKIDNLYLQGEDTTSDIEEADIFESETEPRQRINQMKKDGKLNKKAKITIKALDESKNKLFRSIFKESASDMSLEQYCDSVNSDANYIEAFKDWVRKGIHGKDILSRSRWDEIWDDFGDTFYDDEEEVEVTQFEVDVDAEKPLKVWKAGGKWKCSDGSTYMSYLKPADVVHWLRKDYGRAWLVESTNRKIKEISINFPGSKTFDIYEGFEADVDYWNRRYCEDVDAGVNDPDVGVVEYIAGKIEQEHPTDNPMQFNSLMKWVRETLPKVDKNWYSNMWGPVKEKTARHFDSIKDSRGKFGKKIIERNKLSEAKSPEYQAHLDALWEEGYQAYYDGEGYADYPTGLTHAEAQEWMCGWDAANEEDSAGHSPIRESKIKELYDDLTDEIRNFILHDDEMDNFSGFDSYEFAKEELFGKLSDKYIVTVDCIEELFSEIEYELAHEDEDIPFRENKKGCPRQRIKEDSLDDPDIDTSQTFEGEDLEVLQSYQNSVLEILKEVTISELEERGFKKTRFSREDGYNVYSGGLFLKKVAEPGERIIFTVGIGEYGKIRANGINYSAKDLANMICKAVDNYAPLLEIDIHSVYQASNRGIDNGQWKIALYHNVPEDVLENY